MTLTRHVTGSSCA